MEYLNEKLFFFINGAAGACPLLDGFFIFITDPLVRILVYGALLWFVVIVPFRTKDPLGRLRALSQGGIFLATLGVMRLLVEGIKVAIAFPRPVQILEGVHSLVLFGNYDSFPSAHTAFAFTVATFVFFFHRSLGRILFLIALLVGVSRIYVGVHFPLDVLVGAGIGIGIPLIFRSLFNTYFPK